MSEHQLNARKTADPVGDEILRRINHAEWLRQFAVALEVAPRGRSIPMTPFRAGAIGRLRLVVDYIELLHREARDSQLEITALQHEIDILKLDQGR